MTAINWESKTDELIAAAADGGSLAKIAERLSARWGVVLTRNQIAGQLWRVRKRAEAIDQDEAPRKIETTGKGLYGPLPRGGVSLLDIREGQCRWPHGTGANFRFCGEPIQDSRANCPYCATHATIAWIPHERKLQAIAG